MLLLGGSTPVAARRAARLRCFFSAANNDPAVAEAYNAECREVGFQGFVMLPAKAPGFVHVTHDPERTWAEIGEYLLYEAQTYASFQTPGQWSTPKVDAETVDDLKASAQIVVGTPDEVLEAARAIPPFGAMTFNPMAGGIPPRLAWESLELFAAEVLPRLRPDAT